MRVEERLGPGSAPSCTADYAVWLDEATANVRIVAQGTPCTYAYREEPLGGSTILEEGGDVDDGFREEAEVLIGDIPYTLLTHQMSADPGLSETYLTFGLDVGLVDLWNVFSLSGSGFITYTSYDLLYAEVGGVVYGTLPTANEEETAATDFGLGTAYPNPFRSVVTLTLSLSKSEAVTLEAFDVLGRRSFSRDLGVQAAGESRHVLDGAALPAGVYFVRATTASGEQATRRVVRVE